MTLTNKTADESERLFEGSALFRSGLELPPTAHATVRRGYLAAAHCAALEMQKLRPLIDGQRTIYEALTQSAAAIASLKPAKPRPRQRELAVNALSAIENALEIVKPPSSDQGA